VRTILSARRPIPYQALPFSVTALVPVVSFPALGILDKDQTTSAYFNDAIFLFVGSFLLAAAVEQWQVESSHK
jgi:sodium-dependent dicarboxylate transporter 2/3/5